MLSRSRAEVQTTRLCDTVACNSPCHDIEKSTQYLFSIKFSHGW